MIGAAAVAAPALWFMIEITKVVPVMFIAVTVTCCAVMLDRDNTITLSLVAEEFVTVN